MLLRVKGENRDLISLNGALSAFQASSFFSIAEICVQDTKFFRVYYSFLIRCAQPWLMMVPTAIFSTGLLACSPDEVSSSKEPEPAKPVQRPGALRAFLFQALQLKETVNQRQEELWTLLFNPSAHSALAYCTEFAGV